MGHNDSEEHGVAIKEFLSDWTPLTLDDRATAFDSGPGVLFIDGDEYAKRPVVQQDAELEDDEEETFELTIDATRNVDAVSIRRAGSELHRFDEDIIERTVTLQRHNEPGGYSVHVSNGEGWRRTANVGVERNPRTHLPDGRYYGAVVNHGGELEETFGRQVVSKYRHNAVKSWTQARFIVVADVARQSEVPDDVLHNPTDHDHDLWFNAFYTNYSDVGWTVLEDVLWSDRWPQNEPYSVICVS